MELLSILKDDEFISGQTIAGDLGVTRAAVHKEVSRLRRQGYAVIAEKNRGYMLKSRPDCVAPEEIRRHLPPAHAWGKHIHYFPSTASTQLTAKELAFAGAGDGTLIVAEQQTAGYGRLQRRWSSPAGGLWFSLIVRPRIRPDAVARLTLACSLVLSQTIEKMCGVPSLIKWPNDLVVPGGRPPAFGKLAGIITEMSAEIDRVSWVAIGIGLNVNNLLPAPGAGQAVSLATLNKTPVERARLLSLFLTDFEAAYRRFCRDGFASFAGEYNRRSFLAGKNIEIDTGGAVARGTVASIDADGFLLLRLPDGSVERIIAGTVTRIV